MWINCDCGFDCKTDIKYVIDESSFSVKCISAYPEPCQTVMFNAHFFGNDKYIDFELGKADFENGVYSFDKKIALSHFVSSGIDIDAFSHFSLCSGTDVILKAYPALAEPLQANDDISLVRAKEALASLKSGADFSCEAAESIDYISRHIQNYHTVKIPFLNDFEWHAIDCRNEFFNLSILYHLLTSENFISDNTIWYFGRSRDKRIYAAAVKGRNVNPFSNASDCTVRYSDSKTGDSYYVVGILLLDDGQYFCIPD